jgi:hypothetical protein
MHSQRQGMPATAGNRHAFHASSGGEHIPPEQLSVGAVSTVLPLTTQSQGPGHVQLTEYVVAPHVADSNTCVHAPPATPPPPPPICEAVHESDELALPPLPAMVPAPLLPLVPLRPS